VISSRLLWMLIMPHILQPFGGLPRAGKIII
jgi:hypothetical protein